MTIPNKKMRCAIAFVATVTIGTVQVAHAQSGSNQQRPRTSTGQKIFDMINKDKAGPSTTQKVTGLNVQEISLMLMEDGQAARSIIVRASSDRPDYWIINDSSKNVPRTAIPVLSRSANNLVLGADNRQGVTRMVRWNFDLKTRRMTGMAGRIGNPDERFSGYITGISRTASKTQRFLEAAPLRPPAPLPPPVVKAVKQGGNTAAPPPPIIKGGRQGTTTVAPPRPPIIKNVGAGTHITNRPPSTSQLRASGWTSSGVTGQNVGRVDMSNGPFLALQSNSRWNWKAYTSTQSHDFSVISRTPTDVYLLGQTGPYKGKRYRLDLGLQKLWFNRDSRGDWITIGNISNSMQPD